MSFFFYLGDGTRQRSSLLIMCARENRSAIGGLKSREFHARGPTTFLVLLVKKNNIVVELYIVLQCESFFDEETMRLKEFCHGFSVI